MQNATRNETAPPWVALIYSAIEPVGSRGGGIHNAVIAHAVALQANGIDAVILTSSEACAKEARERAIPVDLDRTWHSGIDPLFSRRIWRDLRRRNGRPPSAIIHNSGRTWFAGNILFPTTLHTHVLHREDIRPYRFYRNWLALTDAYAASLQQTASGRLRRIAVVPNGLPVDPLPPPARRAPGSPLIIGVAGRLNPKKGIDTIIDAASILKANGTNVLFRIAGAHPEGYIKLADQKGVSSLVDFVGWINDIDAFMADIDVFCLPSRNEPFGIVFIEAMAQGIPVIATATNGALEVIEAHNAGWTVPIDDPGALAACIAEVSANPDEILRKGTRAYEVVCREFTPKPVGAKLIRALAKLGARLNTEDLAGSRQTQ